LIAKNEIDLEKYCQLRYFIENTFEKNQIEDKSDI